MPSVLRERLHWVANVASNVSVHEISVPHVMVIVLAPVPPVAARSWNEITSAPWQLSWVES